MRNSTPGQTRRGQIAKGILGVLLMGSFTFSISQRGMVGYVPQVNAGERDLAQHRYTAAASHFRAALVWDHSGAEAHIGLGNVYLKVGLKERASQQFATVLERHPHSAGAERGIHESRSDGEEQQAFQDLEDQVAKSPNEPDLETTYAEELVERNRLDEAFVQAKAALGHDPKQWHAYCALGRIAFARGNLTEAREQLTVAVTHDDTDDDALDTLAKIELAENRPGSAVKWLRKLVSILPDEAKGHESLANALEKAGDHTSALQEASIAKKIRQNAQELGR